MKFPRHSNEIAQSKAYNVAGSSSRLQIDNDASHVDDNDSGKKYKEWIPHWHTGHLYVKGMSKSLKNFIMKCWVVYHHQIPQ